MSSKKRSSETASSSATQRKKVKTSDPVEEKSNVTSVLRPEEVDFPRGGGTSFTPVEYKAIRAEALKELNDEVVFKDSATQNKPAKEKKRKSDAAINKKALSTKNSAKTATARVEHLNYKRIATGMKLLCQIVAVYPFLLIVSLPNQLLAHIPITHISSQLTGALEAADSKDFSEDEEDSDSKQESGPPDLLELFRPGQYLRAVVSAVKPSGTTEGRAFSYSKDEVEKASRRVELSLIPDQVNAGLVKSDLTKGFTLCAAVKSVEDHGYILDFGLPTISGFMPYKCVKNGEDKRRRVGSLVNAVVDKIAEDGRTCIFTADERDFKTTVLKEITNVSSVLPGILVQALVTSIVPSGLVVQVLGSFEGTIDLYHLPSGSSPSDFKIGKKVKARILYDVVGTSPPQFSLSLKEHVVALAAKKRKLEEQSIQESFPVGTILQSVVVKRVEPERGLVVSVEEGVDGFVHISHTSDDHVPSLSSNSGPWKVDTVHQARVVGYHPLDGILQLSLRPSILSQRFLRVDDVVVGELVKGTVKKLTDSALFVSINGNVDAMIWPNHYADIMLRHPQKRFKIGASIKCRVLAVDSNRKRIMLTAKKTLVESDLPILSKTEEAEAGKVVQGVIWKVMDKSLVVEFYNNIRAVVAMREVSETPVTNMTESFSVGKPVKVCILSVDREINRIVASIRQASGECSSSLGDLKSVEIGQTVSGTVIEVHGDNVLLTLDPSRARALISLHNIANNRRQNIEQLRSSLKGGEKMEELVVVSRNLDKGIIIVANRPSPKTQTSKQAALDINSLSIGSIVVGRVLKHGKHGAIVKFPGWITGFLHPTDTCDDFEQGFTSPAVESTLSAAVIAIDHDKKRLTLSTRQSRLDPKAKSKVVDREVGSIKDLKVGQKIRGFIKSVAEHGVFVTVGREVDARVQIKELYDEYVKDWKSGFQTNQLVSGRILSINADKKQIEMSLRSSSSSSASQGVSFSDLIEGQKVISKVKKIEDYGIFVSIEGTKLSGLCHKSEIADNKDADVSLALRNFREGDSVKAIILAIDSEKRRISLGLKPSYFSSEDLESTDEDGAEAIDISNEDTTMQSIAAASSDVEEDGNAEDDASVDDDGDNAMVIDSSVFTPLEHLTPHPPKQNATPAAPVLSLQGFQWTNDIQPQEEVDASSSDEDSEGPSDKKRKKKKGIEQDFTADMQTRMPESVADFERHLLGSPNSSFIWIQYMSFQLQLAEIDKAREVGRRALQAISIREELEKLNVWIALLNLENTYGTEESLEALFKEAARHNDSKTVHLRLANIFDQSDKSEVYQKAEEQYRRTSKKFGSSSKVWTLFGEHYLRRGLMEESRKLLPRSLLSLEKRKHLKTISKFAQLEYKLGDPERGKTIFEGIMDSHPKRWDLWSIYMDMEAGQKDIQSIRNLFDRVFSQKMTSHKAKSFFKKWLEIERRLGDEKGQQMVKEKAIEWTQRTTASS